MSTATLNPLMASTWLIPAARNSADGRERPGSRTPVVMAATNARLSGDAHSGIALESARWVTPRTRTMNESTIPTFIGATSRALVVEILPAARRARDPGFIVVDAGSYQPRTQTRMPREGSGARPETRTSISQSSSPGQLIPTTEVTRRTNDCAAARIAYFES